MHFGGTQQPRAVPLWAETGSRFSANQLTPSRGVRPFLFSSSLSPSLRRPPPAQVSEEAGGDFSVHKSVWFLERAHISQPFSLPQTTPPGEADGDSVSNADGRVGAPQNRTPGGAGLGSVDSCRSRALRQEGQNDTQVAGRQDGRQEPEPRTRAAPSGLQRRPGLTCGRAEHSPPGDGRPEKWGRGPAGPGTEGTVPP